MIVSPWVPASYAPSGYLNNDLPSGYLYNYTYSTLSSWIFFYPVPGLINCSHAVYLDITYIHPGYLDNNIHPGYLVNYNHLGDLDNILCLGSWITVFQQVN
jgi:hypothetical protein